MKSSLMTLAVLFACAGAGHTQQAEPKAAPGQSRIVTTTRLIAQFSELERQWLKALADRNQTAIDDIMSEDFQEWNPQSADPAPREAWLQQHLGQAALVDARLRQMSVRDLGSASLVCFTLSTRTGDWFIVDVWEQANGRFLVTDRYVSRVFNKKRDSTKPSGKR